MPAGFPPLFELQVEEAIVRTKPAVVACSGKHSVLRMFVPGYRILAGLLALGAVAGLLYSIRSAVTMKGEAERMGAISLGFGIFVASGLAALLHLAIAELIRVVLNIEENTHAR